MITSFKCNLLIIFWILLIHLNTNDAKSIVSNQVHASAAMKSFQAVLRSMNIPFNEGSLTDQVDITPEIIGKGSFGTTFKGKTSTGDTVAVKFMLPSERVDYELLLRSSKRELKIIDNLSSCMYTMKGILMNTVIPYRII